MRHDPRRSLHKSRVATEDPSCPPLMLNCGCPAEPRRRAGVSRGIVGGVWFGPLDLRCKPALQRLLIVQDTGSRTVGIEIALHHPLDQHG